MSPPGGLLPLIQCSRPDLILLSSDGQQSYTWRILLAIHSPWVGSLLVSSGVTDCGLSCLSLPASHASLQALLASLASPSSKPLPANEAADLLRINSDQAETGERRAEVVNDKLDLRKKSLFNQTWTSEQKGESSYYQEQSSAEVSRRWILRRMMSTIRLIPPISLSPTASPVSPWLKRLRPTLTKRLGIMWWKSWRTSQALEKPLLPATWTGSTSLGE